MSWQAAEWVDKLPYDAMKPLATRVLLKLANVAAQDGTRAWRNAWEVASELGVDRRSVQRALRELQAADLIRIGDQRAVGHLRSDRRPTVYDLNFGFHRMYAQPEIPLPEDDEEPELNGATQLSTGAHGATNGATRTVPPGTNGTTYQDLEKESSSGERAREARNMDGFAGSHQPAIASAVPEHRNAAGRVCTAAMIDDRHCEFGHLIEATT